MPKNVSDASREPPYSAGYEQAVLAACLLEGGQECVSGCLELKLSPHSFYLPAHQEIFKACLDLFKAGKPVNVLTVGDRLRVDGVLERIGGEVYLNTVTDRIESPAGLAYYAQAVKNLEITRNLVHFFLKGLEEAYRGVNDIDQFLGNVEGRVLEINRDRTMDSALPFQVPLSQASTAIQNLLTKPGEISGVPSGFHDLDVLTNGFHGSEMIVLAARPSMGKTALALNIAEAAILNKNPVPTLFFSLEMSAEQLAMRMICSHGRVNMTKLRAGYLRDRGTQERLAKQEDVFKKVPFWIDESSNLTILEMRSKARRLHAQQALGLVIIDYLQLLSGTDPKLPREQQIAEISRGVKGMAKELNVPVIVLSQLNRESEKEHRQPRLSDLRESGSIEQDADLVLLLSKSFESLKSSEENADAPEDVTLDAVVRDLIIGKQRNGPIGTVKLTYLKPYTRFENFTAERS